ncbi:MAG TPA: histidine kinase [Mycobacteriales bacterium]|nr:histidine kinase [Mycobacteriales bacterium]
MPAAATRARPLELLPRWARWIPFSLYVAVVLVGLVRLNPNPALAAVAALVAIGGGALLLQPHRSLILPYAAIGTAGIAVLGHGVSSNVGWFAVCLIGGWCVMAGERREGLIYLIAVTVLFGIEWRWIEPDPGWGAWIGGTALSTGGCMLMRHEIDLVRRLRAAQAELADQARIQERNRIAHELHDVIAHTLTVSLLHVTSARLAVEFDPEDAARSLAEAERLGRESLEEVRSAVGLLREDGAAGTAPMPSAGDLPELIERFRSARTDVTLTLQGDPAAMPATTGLAAYRICQEALTNAVKHAPGAPITVDLSVDDARVRLSVDSAGKPLSGSGVGRHSMRDRAEAVGGVCTAGPGGRGWLVQATLPLPRGRS